MTMTQEEIGELRKLCQQHDPAKLRLYRADEVLRDVPVPATRKKWLHTLDVVAKLDRNWSHIELCDRKDNVLDVYRPRVEVVAIAPGLDVLKNIGDGTAADLARVIVTAVTAGQRDVIAAIRDRDNTAMNSMVGMMDRVSAAVGTLASVHSATLEAQRQNAQVQIATAAQLAAAQATPAPAAADDDDELESVKTLKMLVPFILDKAMEKYGPAILAMLGPTAPAKPPAKTIDIATAKKAAE